METPKNHEHVGIHDRSRAENLFHSRMRASGHQNQAKRTLYCQVSSRSSRVPLTLETVGMMKMPGTTSTRVSTNTKFASGHGLPVGIASGSAPSKTHTLRQTIHSLVKPRGKRASKDAEQLRWGVDFHFRIDLQEMAKAASVVAMAMGNHDEVQVFQIDIQRFGIGQQRFSSYCRYQTESFCLNIRSRPRNPNPS